ncbi:transglycosylase domain-containing protein [Candidatus Peribacteria bacterium]|nr:transglycosylase domain-containing protein [Candidatus Peribacteria bacterium]
MQVLDHDALCATRPLWWGWRAVRGLLIFGLIMLLLGVLTVAGFVWYFMEDFVRGQLLDRTDMQYPVIITDTFGEEIYRQVTDANREWIDLEQLPESLLQFTVQAEDKRFYVHPGFDPIGIARAAVTNYLSGGISEGASTITQQLARKMFLTDERSLERKLREVVIALGIESTHSKHDILEMYLNVAPYGGQIYGVKAAAETYFSRSPKQLSDAEALVLSTIPQNPNEALRSPVVADWLGGCTDESQALQYSCTPFTHTDYTLSRIETVLLRTAAHYRWPLSRTSKTWAALGDITLPPRRPYTRDLFQHWQEYVKRWLLEQGITRKQYPGGLRVRTTVSAPLQRYFYNLLTQHTAQLYTDWGIENVSLLILENSTRSPIVYIGSKAFWNEDIAGQVNMLTSRRQPGSAIKPLVYAAALQQGYSPSTLVPDLPVIFRGDKRSVQNSDGTYSGNMALRQALSWSRNVPAAKAVYMAGGEAAVRSYLDEHFGLDINTSYPEHQFGWTISLGTVPLRLQDFASAMATLGSAQWRPLCPLLEAETLTGEAIANPCQSSQVRDYDPVTAFLMSDMLSDTRLRSPGIWGEKVTVPDYNMAVKTGTSTKRIDGQLRPVDNLIISWTPTHTFLLWGGNTDGSALKEGAFAALSLGDIWQEVVRTFYSVYPHAYTGFRMPEGVTMTDGISHAVGADLQKTYTLPLNNGQEKTEGGFYPYLLGQSYRGAYQGTATTRSVRSSSPVESPPTPTVTEPSAARIPTREALGREMQSSEAVPSSVPLRSASEETTPAVELRNGRLTPSRELLNTSAGGFSRE